jgi:NADH-quinone oxidoreductase subunit G
MPKIEIDGIVIDAEQGATIIEVADRAAIAIPRFCYHHKLSVAANCRMCLVQVEKSNKALPACATPVAEGMKIWTKSKEAVAAQRAVMEFLLINHPLDCPVCDQGGECELQDVSLMYGNDSSRYTEAKRSVLDQNLGPLISTEMTRCIQCTRCVRFGTEVAGERELGATGRGEYMEIGTFIEQNVNSEVSGNIIDLCPVGALTSKPFRFKARAWELKEKPGVSPHDCIGSNLYLHTFNQKVMRVVPKDRDDLNEVWLSDRDRFSYEGLQAEDRLRKAMVCKQNRWDSVTWGEALKVAVAGLKLAKDNFGMENIGVLVSPNSSNEEFFLLQKLMQNLGGNNIDHRLRQLDFTNQDSAPKFPNLGINFANLNKQDAVLIVGSNLAKEQPLASIKLRQMVKRGGNVCVINPVDYKYNFALAAKSITPATDMLRALGAVAKELITLSKFKAAKEVTEILSSITVNETDKDIAAVLFKAKTKHLILGNIAQMHPDAGQIEALASLIGQIISATWGSFSDGANAAGAWLMGCVPHREINGKTSKKPGKHAFDMLHTPLNAYILYGIEPEFDSVLGVEAVKTLKQADFVIAISAYQTDSLLEIADVILPLALFAENEGSMTNLNGAIQEFDAVVPAFGESRPGWKILRMLGELSGFDGFAYNTVQDITNDINEVISFEVQLPQWQPIKLKTLAPSTKQELVRIAPLALYAVDCITRRAKSLQATHDAHLAPQITINKNTAARLNVLHDEIVKVSVKERAERSVKLQVIIDDSVADYTAIIYQANKSTFGLGLPYTKLEIDKC